MTFLVPCFSSLLDSILLFFLGWVIDGCGSGRGWLCPFVTYGIGWLQQSKHSLLIWLAGSNSSAEKLHKALLWCRNLQILGISFGGVFGIGEKKTLNIRYCMYLFVDTLSFFLLLSPLYIYMYIVLYVSILGCDVCFRGMIGYRYDEGEDKKGFSLLPILGWYTEVYICMYLC